MPFPSWTRQNRVGPFSQGLSPAQARPRPRAKRTARRPGAQQAAKASWLLIPPARNPNGEGDSRHHDASVWGEVRRFAHALGARWCWEMGQAISTGAGVLSLKTRVEGSDRGGLLGAATGDRSRFGFAPSAPLSAAEPPAELLQPCVLAKCASAIFPERRHSCRPGLDSGPGPTRMSALVRLGKRTHRRVQVPSWRCFPPDNGKKLRPGDQGVESNWK